MVTVACILMALGALAFVLFVEPQAVVASVVEQQIAPLERKKEILYENLRDLNFEFRMGKLSESDYQAAKVTSQAELVPVLSARKTGAQEVQICHYFLDVKKLEAFFNE